MKPVMRLHHSLPALLLACLGPVADAADPLVLAGSDLIPESVQEAIVRAGAEEGLGLVPAFEGSLKGREVLASGEARVALLARTNEADFPEDWRVHPFAYQIAAFVVGADNPVVSLTYDQVNMLLRENAPVQEWGGLVDAPDWTDRKVALRALRREDTLSLELVNARILERQSFTDTLVLVETSPETFRKTLVDDPAILAIAPWIEDLPGTRRLPIAVSSESQAYHPSRDNVFFGDYPLRLPFQVIIAGSLSGPLRKSLLEALYSETVNRALEAEDFLPVPEQEQRALLFSID
jgi:hypothetical protein